MPNYNNYVGDYVGKLVRFSLANFVDVDVLDLAAIDSHLKAFNGGFTGMNVHSIVIASCVVARSSL